MAKGLALKGLTVEDSRTGLWGRQIMTLSKGNGVELPTHRFSPGDIVCVLTSSSSSSSPSSSSPSSIRGIIYKVSNEKIQIALSDKHSSVSIKPSEPTTSKQQQSAESDAINLDYTGRIVSIILMGNDTTFKRMELALKRLSSLHDSKSIYGPLNVIFGLETPDNIKTQDYLPLQSRYTSAAMNASQNEAIAGAMACKQVFLIHGPPGTGKTTVLVEYILQAVKRQGQKVLVCAPSNVAVDNIVERLAPFARASGRNASDSSSANYGAGSGDFKIVRIGHPARVQGSALQFTIEEQYRQSNGYEVVQSLQEDMDKTARTAQKSSTFAERRQLKRDWIDMKRDLKKVTTTSMKQVIMSANVVLATCTGADDKLLRNVEDFDVVVVDEAAQALDPIILIPLLKAKKIILAGDHLQLPPTIKSPKAIEQSLCTTTFFERCIRRYPSISKLLSVQYRMNDLIMSYSSSALYRGKLTSDESVKEHLLTDLLASRSSLSSYQQSTLPASSSSTSESSQLDSAQQPASQLEEYLKNPLVLVDTAGCSFEESGGANESKWNEGEAKVVVALVSRLIAAGVAPKDVGIISPYNAQVDLLRNRLRPQYAEIEIASVDSFQGREKECIIYTLVRSNPHRNVGFLSSDQRTNVAITRAKRLLMIVADTETLGAHKFLKRLFNFCENNAQYWSAAEFEQTYEAVDNKTYTGKGKNKGKVNKKTAAATAKPKERIATTSSEDRKNEEEEGGKKDVAPKKEEKEQEMNKNAFDVLASTSETTGLSTAISTEEDMLKPTQASESITTGSRSEKHEENLANISSSAGSSLANDLAPLEIVRSDIKASNQVTSSAAPTELEAPKPAATTVAPPASASVATAVSPKENARITTKPPMDYREMQKAKFEAQKQSAQQSSSPASHSGVSPSSSAKSASSSNQDSRFGLSSSYFPQPSMHAPKQSGAKKSSYASSGASKPTSTQAPVPVKASLLKLDDDDAFLDGLIKESEKCYAKGCKESTKLFGESCKFCRHMYCLSHWGPETHGCNDAAKKEGIAEAKKKSVDVRIKTSAKPVIDGTPKMKDWQKNIAQDKLAKKMQAQKEERSKKPNAKK